MTVEIALVVVALVLIGVAASRVMMRERSTAVAAPPPRSPAGRPHYVARHPRHFALPPVTIETLPIDFNRTPEIVPPIDHRVLAALVASGSRAAEMPRPEQFARGSIPPSYCDVDDAETVRPASDLDDDAETRTNMSPVR